MNTHPKYVAKNMNSESIPDISLKLNRWLLLSIGGWPQSSTVKKILVLIQIFINASSVAIVLIPCMLYVLFEDEHIQIRLGALVSLFFRVMGTTSYWMIITREKDIYNCIRDMETNWILIQRSNDRKVMLQYAKTASGMIKFFASFLSIGSALFVIARAAKTTTFTVGNETFTTHQMACPVYKKIIDVRFNPANKIFLSFQVFSSLVTSLMVLTFFSIAAVFAMHACGQLQVLYIWLKEVAQSNKKNNLAKEKLTIIVKHHLRIFSLIKSLESIISPVCMIILMGCTLDMCLLGYYAILNWAAFDTAKMLSYFFVYTSVIYNIFVYCYIGEILTEQCRNVGEVAYMSDWYKLPHTTARSFILIIMRSNQTIKITAGKIFQLSIGTFGDIVKTSVAYLNLLRTMTT